MYWIILGFILSVKLLIGHEADWNHQAISIMSSLTDEQIWPVGLDLASLLKDHVIIEAFFDALERRQWELSFSSGLSSRRFVNHSMWPRQGVASPILGQVGLVSRRALSPGWGRPNWSPSTLGCSPFGINSVAAATLGFGFCLVLVFHRETYLFHCNCDDSFAVNQGPRSCSSSLWQLVL
jgi:hypothetical protein